MPRGNISIVNVEATHHILNTVNGILMEQGKSPLFKIQLIGHDTMENGGTGSFMIKPQQYFQEVDQTDLIIIPAIFGDYKTSFEENKDFAPWIIQQYKKGAEIATMCIGSFFLAQTGLLKDKQCATHWAHANAFRKMFPEINLVDDKIMTADDGIYTSGGAYSFLNLVLYLVEKYAGREMAILISKTYLIDIEKSSQSPFTIFRGQMEHQDKAVKKAQLYIEENYQEKLSVEELADQFAVSRRSLERRFKKATSNTISEYIQRVKVEAAKNKLESGRNTVNEVMYDVGYSDMKSFRNTFRKYTGMSPVKYRNKYNKERAVA